MRSDSKLCKGLLRTGLDLGKIRSQCWALKDEIIYENAKAEEIYAKMNENVVKELELIIDKLKALEPNYNE